MSEIRKNAPTLPVSSVFSDRRPSSRVSSAHMHILVHTYTNTARRCWFVSVAGRTQKGSRVKTHRTRQSHITSLHTTHNDTTRPQKGRVVAEAGSSSRHDIAGHHTATTRTLRKDEQASKRAARFPSRRGYPAIASVRLDTPSAYRRLGSKHLSAIRAFYCLGAGAAAR